MNIKSVFFLSVVGVWLKTLRILHEFRKWLFANRWCHPLLNWVLSYNTPGDAQRISSSSTWRSVRPGGRFCVQRVGHGSVGRCFRTYQDPWRHTEFWGCLVLRPKAAWLDFLRLTLGAVYSPEVVTVRHSSPLRNDDLKDYKYTFPISKYGLVFRVHVKHWGCKHTGFFWLQWSHLKNQAANTCPVRALELDRLRLLRRGEFRKIVKMKGRPTWNFNTKV